MAQPITTIGEASVHPQAGTAVTLEGVVKRFGDVVAVAGVSLDVHEIGRASCRERVSSVV